MEPRVELWGLTGGIAAGKSLAAQIFRDLGLEVIDADQIAKTLTLPGGAAAPRILAEFGTLDRGKLRDLIFSNPERRKTLEGILHPLIQEESRRQMQLAAERRRQAPNPSQVIPVLYEAALLIESGRAAECQGVIVITSPLEVRLERLMSRDGITADLARKIIRSQTSDEKRAEAATFILSNEAEPEALRTQVEQLAKRLQWIQ